MEERKDRAFSRLLTWIIVVEAPCLDVVLGELSVGEQFDGVGHQLHVALREPQQLEIYPADLSVEGVVMEQVGAVELLIMGLVQSQLVLHAFEYFNLHSYSNVKKCVIAHNAKCNSLSPHPRPPGRSFRSLPPW